MVRLGRVQDNLMINVQATNDKLRARAVRLVAALTGASETASRSALESLEWSVTAAISRLGRPRDRKMRKSS
jgi:N-acetylmuramic acid 6-phosphate etherase